MESATNRNDATGWPTRFTLAAILLTSAGAAGADCIPVKAPGVITAEGSYCLVEDFVGTIGPGGAAIQIEADHVVLDLQGHVIRNTFPPEKGHAGTGVMAWERSHIVVRDGSIAGFWEGVSLGQGFFGPTYSVNHLVEGMRVYDCQRFGIGVGGVGSVVRDNVIWNIHGIGIETDVTGIFVSGGAHRVIGNEITRVVGASHNRWGIRILEGVDSIVVGNRLIATHNGIYLDKTGSVYRDNFVGQIPSGNVAFSGGIDAGGNVTY